MGYRWTFGKGPVFLLSFLFVSKTSESKKIGTNYIVSQWVTLKKLY